MRGEWTVTQSSEARVSLEWMRKALQGPELCLDLAELVYLDSNAIQLLVEMSHRLKKQGKRLCLVCVPPSLMKIFRVIHLSQLFSIEALNGSD